jgi:hypothetical protein
MSDDKAAIWDVSFSFIADMAVRRMEHILLWGGGCGGGGWYGLRNVYKLAFDLNSLVSEFNELNALLFSTRDMQINNCVVLPAQQADWVISPIITPLSHNDCLFYCCSSVVCCIGL